MLMAAVERYTIEELGHMLVDAADDLRERGLEEGAMCFTMLAATMIIGEEEIHAMLRRAQLHFEPSA